jgi:hypothetical protein
MPGSSRDDLASLSLGQRDTLLLRLRQITFGDSLPVKVNCPQCQEILEMALSCNELATETDQPQTKQVSHDDYTLHVRPLNSFDMAAAANTGSVEESRQVLLRRCISNAKQNNHATELESLPSALERVIEQVMQSVDTQAESLLNLTCPECQHQWQAVLDMGHILWLEVTARAQRLLREVHLLAQAYGWGEDEILRLSPTRRAAYLHMVAT